MEAFCSSSEVLHVWRRCSAKNRRPLWALTKRHFGGKGAEPASVFMLLGATFWLEYAYAIWPHSIGVLSVTLALWMILDALDADSGFAMKAVAAGAAIGFGFLSRTDTNLALPAPAEPPSAGRPYWGF